MEEVTIKMTLINNTFQSFKLFKNKTQEKIKVSPYFSHVIFETFNLKNQHLKHVNQ